MSADLFAAFDNSASEPTPSQSQGPAGGYKSPTFNADASSFLNPNIASDPSHVTQQPTQWTSALLQPQQSNGQASPWLATGAQHQSQQQQLHNVWQKSPGLSEPGEQLEKEKEDDENWGDFEVATQHSSTDDRTTNSMASNLSKSVARPIDYGTSGLPRARIVRAPTLELMTNSLVDIGHPTSRKEPFQERPSWEVTRKSFADKPKAQDPNVLFDADDFDGVPPEDDEDEDTFGDFETVAPSTGVKSEPLVDLLSTDAVPPQPQAGKAPPSHLLSTLAISDGPSLYPTAPKSPSFLERNPFPGLELTTPKAVEFPPAITSLTSSPVTAWPSFEEVNQDGVAKERNSFEEDWGKFGSLPSKDMKLPGATRESKDINPSKTAKVKPLPETLDTKAAEPSSDWDWDAWDAPAEPSLQATRPSTKGERIQDQGPPPTNVPPPAILLSVFPQLLASADTLLLKPTARHASATVKERVFSDPATVSFLRGYLSLATVAARIMAGRKLRWHRDKFLSQGMAISAAGGRGGMKLSGIDRSQTAREDREAADVAAVWSGVVGRLRSAVAATNTAAAAAGEPQMKVPELVVDTGTGVVKTVQNVPTAPKSCVVCGLKRDERVARVDHDVEDSFGEWWAEFWGHRACKNFWIEHEAALRQR